MFVFVSSQSKHANKVQASQTLAEGRGFVKRISKSAQPLLDGGSPSRNLELGGYRETRYFLGSA